LIAGAAEIEADDTRLQAIQAEIIQSDRANSSAFSSKSKDDSPHAELTSYFVSFIRGAKNKGKRPSDYRDADHVNVYNMYAKLCQERGLIDFGDMIPMAIDLLQRRSDILQTYQNLYRCVLVDEYQDIDAQQFELLMLICRQHGNITVCGDDDQVIFNLSKLVIHFYSDC
jgi:superfamily I DNA/RNA helicase